MARDHIQKVFFLLFVFKHNYFHLYCLYVVFFTSSASYIIKQLLTIGALSTREYQYWLRLGQHLVFSGRHHVRSNATIVNNCIILTCRPVWSVFHVDIEICPGKLDQLGDWILFSHTTNLVQNSFSWINSTQSWGCLHLWFLVLITRIDIV